MSVRVLYNPDAKPREIRFAAFQGFLTCTKMPPTREDARTILKGRFFYGYPGTYGPITVRADGGIEIGTKAYADDVVAFVSAAIESNTQIDAAIKKHLRDFINAMDARAFERHGFCHSEVEHRVPWNPDYKATPDEAWPRMQKDYENLLAATQV